MEYRYRLLVGHDGARGYKMSLRDGENVPLAVYYFSTADDSFQTGLADMLKSLGKLFIRLLPDFANVVNSLGQQSFRVIAVSASDFRTCPTCRSTTLPKYAEDLIPDGFF